MIIEKSRHLIILKNLLNEDCITSEKLALSKFWEFTISSAVWTWKRSVKTHTTVMKRHNWRSEKDIIDGHSESVVSYPVFIFFRGPVPGPLRFIALGFRKRVMQMLLALFLWPYGRLSLTGNSVFTWPGIVSLMAVSDSCLQKDTLKRPGSDITVLYCGIRLLFYFRKSEKSLDVTIGITSKQRYINHRKM